MSKHHIENFLYSTVIDKITTPWLLEECGPPAHSKMPVASEFSELESITHVAWSDVTIIWMTQGGARQQSRTVKQEAQKLPNFFSIDWKPTFHVCLAQSIFPLLHSSNRRI